MSETTAFLAGSAVAGVAALLALKTGDISLSQPQVDLPYGGPPNALVTPVPVAPALIQGPYLPNTDSSDSENEAILRSQLDNNKSATDELKLQLEQQRFLTEQLKFQLEQQRDTTAQLKSQLEDQRREATDVIDRLREQQRSMDMLTLQQALPRDDQNDSSLLEQAELLQTLQNGNQNNSSQVVALWALGGILLLIILGGSAVLLAAILVMLQRQKSPKPAPVVHHPVPISLPYGQYPYGSQGVKRSPLLLPPYVRRSAANGANPYNPYNPYTPYRSGEGTPPPNFRDWE